MGSSYFPVILIFGFVFLFGNRHAMDSSYFPVILIFGFVFLFGNRHASVGNAAPPTMSRTKFYLWVAVTAVLFTSGMRAYSSYFKWRTLSTISSTVDPPKQLPDVLARP